MAPLRPSGSRAAAPTAVVKGRAALTRSTKEGRLQTRPPATCASRNQRHGTSVPKLRRQNIQAPHSSPNPAFKTRSRELDTLPVQMWCSASSGVVMAPLRALPPAAHSGHGIIITSHPTTRPSARLPIAHARYASPPPRLMDAAAAPTDHLRRSLASSVVPS